MSTSGCRSAVQLEHVDVEANAIQVQTDSASLGETVDGQQVLCNCP